MAEVEAPAEEAGAYSLEDLSRAVMNQGAVLDAVASLARKAKLSGNPGVSAVGEEILTVVERVL